MAVVSYKKTTEIEPAQLPVVWHLARQSHCVSDLSKCLRARPYVVFVCFFWYLR